ncbi:MAG: NifU family protein [Bacteroidota bacterium]|nr:NifU family protein [Bacteroidota bacterium]
MMTTEQKEEITRKVKNVLEQIRPYIQQDGGDIEFVDLTDDMVVNVELKGACGSCPYSTMTLKGGVETTIKNAIPEIQSVESIN